MSLETMEPRVQPITDMDVRRDLVELAKRIDPHAWERPDSEQKKQRRKAARLMACQSWAAESN